MESPEEAEFSARCQRGIGSGSVIGSATATTRGGADFLRTYDVTAMPRRTGPSEETYVDRFGEVRRTFTVVYDRPADSGGSFGSEARITVRVESLLAG